MIDEETEIIKDVKLNPIMRKIMVALITIDVHNRDIISDLAKEAVFTLDDFNW